MFVRSFLLGISALSCASLYALEPQAIKISGSIALEGQSPFQPEDAENAFNISDAKIKFKGDVTDKWKYEIVTQHPSKMLSLKFDDEIIQFKSLIVKYDYSPQAQLTIGKTSPRFSQAAAPCKSYIKREIGVLTESIGDQLGFKVEGMLHDKYGYSFGLWKATARPRVSSAEYSAIAGDDYNEEIDVVEIGTVVPRGDNNAVNGDTLVTTTSHELKIGSGGRFNAVFHDTESLMWGGGFGWQSVNVIVPLVVEYDTQTVGQEPISGFENRYALTLDQSIGTKFAVLNLAVQHFQYQRENNSQVSTAVDAIAPGINVFQSKNMANAASVEMSYLLIGKGYKMNKDHGVVADHILSDDYGALEIACRAGVESYFNAAAAQYLNKAYNSNPDVPFVFNKKDGYNLVLLNPALMTAAGYNEKEAIHIRVTGYTLDVNYFMNKNIAFKAEYYNQKTVIISPVETTTLEKREGVRLRSEYSF